MSSEPQKLTAISAKGLSYSHKSVLDDETTVIALNSVNLALPRGSRTLLIGANGAGKSTLLQILAGKKLIKNGEVTIFGRDVFRDAPPVSLSSCSPVLYITESITGYNVLGD